MYSAIVLLSLVAVVLGQDDFYERYGFTKVMASCFGEELYYNYLAKIATAQQVCLQLPISSLHHLDYTIHSNLGYPNQFGGASSYPPYQSYPSYPSYHPGQPLHHGVQPGYHHGVPTSYHQGVHQYQFRKKRQAEQEEEEEMTLTTLSPTDEEQEEQPQKEEAQEEEETADQTEEGAGETEGENEHTDDQEPSGSVHLPGIYAPHDEAIQDLDGMESESQQHEPFFSRYYLLDSVNKITASLSNYTCTLHQIGAIDEYLNINVDQIINQYVLLPLNDQFKEDLIDGVNYCRDMSYCLPLHNQRSPLPLNIQRLLMAMECEKEMRTNACFREDLRKNIGEFDLSLFPSEDDQSTVLNKLAAIVSGVDSLSQLEIL